ncbi:hypothetical protein BDN70DRAFT_271111 [Pholiota conissans]|uniref:F-box domain-containing protein n=1 Tax=Pholiota conissans TaxID=109636 RepID=A0A9P5YTJ9_9AGAR|nr:hypothetical protein BDN70DRAFT_271111 [Pholiota conissans]
MDSETSEPLTSSSISNSPIFKLHRDLLWSIFSLNGTYSSFYSANCSENSPLTTTRRSSQVCVLWRQIILDSPSIWGNCMDLDLLGQECSDWRDEVLRRTGSAPLCVQARYAKAVTSNTDIHRFLVDLIDAHWERIQVFDIYVQLRQTLNDARVWSAFSRPAPNLRMFSLSSLNNSIETIAGPFPKHSMHLFSDKAPVLAQFSLRDNTIVMPISFRPFPPALLSANLQHLSLHQPTEFAATDLLAACEQMPNLKVLGIVISRLIAGDPQNEYMYSHRKVSLPSLMAITIAGPELAIYPAFLGRISAHPGCALSVDTTLSPTGSGFPEKETAKVQEMLQIFLQYSNTFFDHYRDGQYALSVAVLPCTLNLETYQHRYYFCLTGNGHDDIPRHILDMILNTVAALKFPSTITQLRLFLVLNHPPVSYPTLYKLFLALGSIIELTTHPKSLSHIHNISLSEDGNVLFPLLKVIYLRGSSGTWNTERQIKPFLFARRSTVPIETLDLTRSTWPPGDLRFLDALTGLKLLWTQDRELHEYICGSGNPESLLFSKDIRYSNNSRTVT